VRAVNWNGVPQACDLRKRRFGVAVEVGFELPKLGVFALPLVPPIIAFLQVTGLRGVVEALRLSGLIGSFLEVL
jgi:hypothetical protein